MRSGRHEEFRNGPEVKIYIWEVLFWSSEKFRALSVLYRECRKGSGGPPRGAPAPRGPCARDKKEGRVLKGEGTSEVPWGGRTPPWPHPSLKEGARLRPPLSLGPIYSGGKGGQPYLSPGASLSLP